jgi:hypothetical protein
MTSTPYDENTEGEDRMNPGQGGFGDGRSARGGYGSGSDRGERYGSESVDGFDSFGGDRSEGAADGRQFDDSELGRQAERSFQGGRPGDERGGYGEESGY